MSEKHILEIIIDMCEKYNDIACKCSSVASAVIEYQHSMIAIMSLCTGALAMSKENEQKAR